jgi:hypothetical protein
MTETKQPARDFLRVYRRYAMYLGPVAADPAVRGYFSLIASFLLTAFLLVFALSPTINTIVGLRRKIDDQNRVLRALEVKIAALVTAQENLRRAESKLPLLFQALPDFPQPQDVVLAVASASAVAPVKLISLQFKSLPLSGQSGAAVNFSLALTGTGEQAEGFIRALEGRRRYIRTETLALSAQGVNIVGESYYYSGK